MSRYIKFDDAVKVMACEMYAEAQSQGFDVDSVEDFIPEAKAWINDAPSIDIEPKRGEWIDFKNGWKCSACGKWNNETSNFCPNCGADMRGEQE